MLMTNADWWARVVQVRSTREDLLAQARLGTPQAGHEAALDLRAVPGVRAEIALTVGEWRRSRLFRSHEQAELVGAIADTRATFRGGVGMMMFARSVIALVVVLTSPLRSDP
jgi:hypothetical protein